MTPKTKVYIANSLMVAGLLPYLIIFIYVVLTSSETGDAAMAAVFMILLGLGVAYVVALFVAFPAFLWSRSLSKSLEVDSSISILLRRAVICSVFPVFAIFPFFAVAVFT